jgi:hypothetical protein
VEIRGDCCHQKIRRSISGISKVKSLSARFLVKKTSINFLSLNQHKRQKQHSFSREKTKPVNLVKFIYNCHTVNHLEHKTLSSTYHSLKFATAYPHFNLIRPVVTSSFNNEESTHATKTSTFVNTKFKKVPLLLGTTLT